MATRLPFKNPANSRVSSCRPKIKVEVKRHKCMHPMYIGGPMMKGANGLGGRKRVPNGTYYNALIYPSRGTHGLWRHT